MRTPMFKQSLQSVGASDGFDDVLAQITDADVPEFAVEATVAVFSHAGGQAVASTGSAVLQAERAVIGALLTDNELYDVVIDILRAEDFSDAATRAVFKAIADIVEGRTEGQSVAEPMTVAVQPGISRLVTIDQLDQWVTDADVDPSVLSSRAKVVRGAGAERGLGVAVAQAQTILAEEGSVESKSDEILKLLSGASEIRSLPVTTLGQAAYEALTELAERAKSGDTGIGIPTGFRDLDALTAGLHGGQLIVIAARPGVGKTAFALSLGRNAAAAGSPVVMASMEMKRTELAKRALAIESGVDLHAIRIGALTEGDWEAIVEAGERLKALPFEIVDLPNVNLSALSGLARRLYREGKLKLLLVDYLQIMDTVVSKNNNREQQIAELTRGLKKLAMQLDIPVVILSQLSRAVEGRTSKRPQLSDLRESGAIEQDADVVIFIHREDVADKNASSHSVADVIVEKQRAGAPGEIQVRFERRTTGFFEFESVRTNDPLKLAA